MIKSNDLRYATAGKKIRVLVTNATTGEGEPSIAAPDTLLIWKYGGALAAPSDGTWAEVGGSGNGRGLYDITFDDTDANTIGPYGIHIEHAGCVSQDIFGFVRPQQQYDDGFAGDAYAAGIDVAVDDVDGADRWTVVWLKNLAIFAPTACTLELLDSAGTQVFSETMTKTGNVYTLNRTGEDRIAAGDQYVAKASCTVSGTTYTWQKIITRDA